MSKTVKIFAYGSNMSTERLQNRVSSTKPLGCAKLPDKSLVCNKKGEDGSGKANLTDTAGDTVWGVLYEMDSAELGKLDRYEKGYSRKSLDVITEQGSSAKAYVYVSSQLTADTRPYHWYKNLMIKGAREHHLPESYISQCLEKLGSKPDPRPRSVRVQERLRPSF